LVPHLARAQEHLALDDVLAGGAVEDVEPGEEALRRPEHRQVDDLDPPHHLAARLRLDPQAALGQRALEGGPLVGAERKRVDLRLAALADLRLADLRLAALAAANLRAGDRVRLRVPGR